MILPTEVIDTKGRVRRRYRHRDLMTPYDKLRSLPGAEPYLQICGTFEQLDAIAYVIRDNQAARKITKDRQELFRAINESLTTAA